MLAPRPEDAAFSKDSGIAGLLGFDPGFFGNVLDAARKPIGDLTGTNLTGPPQHESTPYYKDEFSTLMGLGPQNPGGYSPMLRSPQQPPGLFESTPFSGQFKGTPFEGLFTQKQDPGLNLFTRSPANDTGVTLKSPTNPDQRAGGWTVNLSDYNLVKKVKERKAAIATGQAPPPDRTAIDGDLIGPAWQEFGNPTLDAQFAQQGLAGLTDAACGPIAIAAMLKAYGINTDPAIVARYGYDTGEWKADGMQRGDGSGIQTLLKHFGLDTQNVQAPNPEDIISLVSQGTPVILNFPTHYMIAQAYDPNTGKFFVGASGSNALQGGHEWMSLQEMNSIAGNGGHLESYIAPAAAAATESSGGITGAASAIAAGVNNAGAAPIVREADTSSHEAFVKSLLPVAQDIERRTGLPAIMTLAIAAHESGWGSAGENMLFGVKGPGRVYQTWETDPNQPVMDSFRVFNSANESFQNFADLVQSGPGNRYAGAYAQLQQTGDWRTFLKGINQAGYARDPVWYDKIARMANSVQALLST